MIKNQLLVLVVLAAAVLAGCLSAKHSEDPQQVTPVTTTTDQTAHAGGDVQQVTVSKPTTTVTNRKQTQGWADYIRAFFDGLGGLILPLGFVIYLLAHRSKALRTVIDVMKGKPKNLRT